MGVGRGRWAEGQQSRTYLSQGKEQGLVRKLLVQGRSSGGLDLVIVVQVVTALSPEIAVKVELTGFAEGPDDGHEQEQSQEF